MGRWALLQVSQGVRADLTGLMNRLQQSDDYKGVVEVSTARLRS